MGSLCNSHQYTKAKSATCEIQLQIWSFKTGCHQMTQNTEVPPSKVTARIYCILHGDMQSSDFIRKQKRLQIITLTSQIWKPVSNSWGMNYTLTFRIWIIAIGQGVYSFVLSRASCFYIHVRPPHGNKHLLLTDDFNLGTDWRVPYQGFLLLFFFFNNSPTVFPVRCI